jgi:polyferredoxin
MATRRKKLARRAPPDRAQRIRRLVQAGFLLLNVAIGVQFWLWVRGMESGGAAPAVARPPGVEGWLPIAGLMNLKAFVLTGEIPRVHAAGMFLLVTFLATAFLVRKAFCAWLCPVGTLSESLAWVGRGLLGRTFLPPRWLDVPLRGLKYLLLGFFVWAVGRMTPEAIRAFVESPYGLVADVKMLDFFRHLTLTSAVVLTVLVLTSMVVTHAWCRYLCPYGALLGLAALASPLSIRRHPDPCIDCGRCARACPAGLPVDRKLEILSAECTACLQCVSACPAAGALELSALGRRRVPAWAVAAALVALLVGVTGLARAMGWWDRAPSEERLRELIPMSRSIGHA